MPAPIRFSVTLAGPPADQIPDLARRAAELGISTITMPDHLDDQPAPLPTLLAAALAAPSVRIMPLVLANDYRHPAMLAKEAATVDVLTGGRLELGIGAGWMASDYDQMGITLDRPGIRIDRLRESIEILKGLFTGSAYSFSGDHYRISGLTSSPMPMQRPHPPIVVAGGGRKILTLAAEHADIIGVNPNLAAGVIDHRAGPSATPAATDEKLAWIRDAAGSRIDRIELHTRVHLAAITDDRESYGALVAPALGIDVADAIESPHALVGTVQQCVDTVMRWRDRWGISYIGLSADAMEPMAGVIAATVGR